MTETERPRLPLIEICVEGIDGLLAAQAAGADRVELCASLVEGGITPSFGTVRTALELATIPFHVIVRPRGGDFLYSEAEYRSMLADVRALAELGVAGVVIGCLAADGTIDEQRMSELAQAAGSLNVTCHRAFDMTRDPTEALESLIRCKVGRCADQRPARHGAGGRGPARRSGQAGWRPHHHPRLRRA
ncbi:hypothetical protein NKJ87_09285 [Mesorhizobium sp. M0027]|uniref:copper homeostasis protein CutC n=1 Tax=Mesorhizobium sp. M0027 TaxID=2956848 RepID=UPI00333785A5